MKSIAALLLGALSLAFAAPNAQVARIRTVYLLPMNNGLDQYLANRLTNLGVFRVVTDPGKADAILTDQLGQAFESRFAELYPEPGPDADAPSTRSEAKGTRAKAAEPVKAGAPAPARSNPGTRAGKRKSDAGAAKKASGSAVQADTSGGTKGEEPASPSASAPVVSFELKGVPPAPVSTFRRGKGTVFLVDRYERVVVWSIYKQPKNTTAAELHRAAGTIAERLTKEAKRK